MQILQNKIKISCLKKQTYLFTFNSFLIGSLLTLISCSGCKSSFEKNESTKSQTTVQSTSSTQNEKQATPVAEVSKQENEISIMSFNVENLFDATHDENREDYTYLAKKDKNTAEVQKFCSEMKNHHYKDECFNLDWNESVIQTKLKNVGEVIRYVDQGKGPDNLMLIEVENESILKRLVKEQLNDLGYQTIVLLEGPDLRGIDPGFISKFPLAEKPKLHIIPFSDSNPEELKWAKRSRGILEVSVRTPSSKIITFLVGHFPSQSNPVAWRAQAVQFAKKLISEYSKQGRSVIMGGDLNITDDEEAEQNFFKKDFSEVGQVSHIVCGENCPGSHFYKGHWSHLDALIYSHNLKQNNFELIPNSIRVLKVPVHMKKNGTPLRFSIEKKEGVSDHYPLYSRLKILNAKDKK